MKKTHRRAALAATFLSLLLLCCGVETLHSQVSVAPAALFIDSRSGIGNLYVTNTSSAPQEVSIDFTFGYPSADSAGKSVIDYADTVAAQTYALNQYIRAYPRSFVLKAKEEQTVRLQVRTKSSVKDAFLFTRVKVTSAVKSPEIEKKVTEGVTTQIALRFEQIFPVFYRKGNVTTGLTVHDVSTSVKEKTLTAVADVERTGAAPFIGSTRAVLYSAANTEVARFEETTSIYFRVKQKMDIDISKAGKGEHRLVLTYETKRSDIAAEDLVQAPPMTKEVTVNVQ